MSDAKTSAHAEVVLTIRVQVNDSWGKTCSIEQVHQQAAESAVGRIIDLASKGRLAGSIIDTKVKAIIVQQT